MFLYLFLYCVLLLFIKFMLRCGGDYAFSASFVRGVLMLVTMLEKV